MKICVFLTIYSFILGLGQCQANTWKCEYKSDTFIYLSALNKSNTSGYTCVLKSNNENEVNVTHITGQHLEKMNDDDVIFLKIYNNLTYFDTIFCEKFKNLKVIAATSVKIKTIEGNALNNCKQLEYLKLGFNNLQDVPRNLLPHESKVTKVDIYFNNLMSLSEKLFENQYQIEELHLYVNKIFFIPSRTFLPLANLRVLNLRKNKLQVFNQEWFANLQNLKVLNLEENQFSEMPQGILKPLRNLQYLFLDRNKIKFLYSDSFEGLENLKILKIWKNEIFDLPPGVFVPLNNLNFLDLGFNYLTMIHSDSFGNHKDLTQIIMDGNKIEAFDERIFHKIASESLGMWNNSCINESKSITKNEIKAKLHNCFQNYEPRPSYLNFCGTFKRDNRYVTIGKQITRGSFPWIAALENENGEVFCGGTLVTNRKIVTAAHCIKNENDTYSMQESDITVVLGAHNLSDPNEDGRASFGVLSVHIHPDWNSSIENNDADIAVLVLNQEVTFNQYIEPACLIDHHITRVGISHGTVVGFMKIENDNIASAIDTSIIRNRVCLQINPDLRKISSNRTFCGVSSNGICNIESGSGLYAYHDGAYFLHAIASFTHESTTNQCDDNSIAIFTRIISFADWVNGISFEADEIHASEYNGSSRVNFTNIIYILSLVLVMI